MLAAALLALPLLYVLSIGPAWRMTTRGVLSKQAFITFYANPLMRPGDSWVPRWVQLQLGEYMGWCDSLGRPDEPENSN